MIYFSYKLGDCLVFKSVSWNASDSCSLRALPEYVETAIKAIFTLHLRAEKRREKKRAIFGY